MVRWGGIKLSVPLDKMGGIGISALTVRYEWHLHMQVRRGGHPGAGPAMRGGGGLLLLPIRAVDRELGNRGWLGGGRNTSSWRASGEGYRPGG